MFEMPHKKMEKVKSFGFVAKCDCGHKHRFKGSEIDLENSNSSTAIFKDIYKCPKCNTTYNGIFETIHDRNLWYRNLNPIGVFISILLIVGLSYGGYRIFSPILNPQPTTTDFDKISNKEYNDFLKWDSKEQQKKRENSPAFNNGN